MKNKKKSKYFADITIKVPLRLFIVCYLLFKVYFICIKIYKQYGLLHKSRRKCFSVQRPVINLVSHPHCDLNTIYHQ